MANLLFDLSDQHGDTGNPSLWLKVASLLTIGYIVFGLILIGVPALSRGAVGLAIAAFLWAVVGIVIQEFKFPRILILPMLFYIYALFSGVYVDVYPIEYMGMMTTIWIGAIALAIFVANGVSLSLIIAGFVVLLIVNMIAVGVGYDGYLINVQGENIESLERREVTRYSGLAGQSNLLISLVFTLPFLLFLTKKKPGFAVYILMIAAAVVTAIVSGSRSAIAFTALFSICGALWLIGNSWIRSMTILATGTAAIMLIVFFNSPGAIYRVERSPIGDLVVVKRAIAAIEGEENSGEVRISLITESKQYFLEKPLIGHGPNTFSTVTGTGQYAHNNLAEVAVNWGSVGLLFYYAMYVAVLIGIGKRIDYKLPMIATLLFLLLADLWFVTYLDRAMVLCLCLLLVMVFRSNQPSRKSGRRRRRRRRPRPQSELSQSPAN